MLDTRPDSGRHAEIVAMYIGGTSRNIFHAAENQAMAVAAMDVEIGGDVPRLSQRMQLGL